MEQLLELQCIEYDFPQINYTNNTLYKTIAWTSYYICCNSYTVISSDNCCIK